MNFFSKHFGEAHVRQDSTYGALVLFSVFLSVLKKASLPTDSIRFKKANIERMVNGYKNGIILEDSDGIQKQWITSGGILKYVFKHSSEIAFCSALAEEVDSIVCHQQGILHHGFEEQNETCASQTSILQLYKDVSSLSFRDEELTAFYSSFFETDETSLPTLYVIHKEHFTEYDWKKIMFFEHHYALTYGTDPLETSEAELECREKYLKLLCKTKEVKEELLAVNKKTTQLRNVRKGSSEIRMNTYMKGHFLHSYECIDRQVQEEVRKYTTDTFGLTIIPSSRSNHVGMCMDELPTSSELSDIYSIVSSFLMNKHKLCLEKVFLLGARTFKTYYRKELKNYARFILHDDIVTQKVKPIMVFSLETEDDAHVTNDGDQSRNCQSCFLASPPKPLEIGTFDLLQEWVTDVPLIVQLLLESSINMKYFKKATDKSKFLQPKLMKLYMCYDTMLNSLNHKYMGLLQQVNTLELIMYSKSLETVFKVASSSGTSMSLASADRYLESKCVDDLLYYNTYIKSRPMIYKCKGVDVTRDICLRDCIIILMVDNLVRLKYRDDPNPGENRSKQLNTLPISLQGIPLDSDEVASWHQKTCDGTSDCLCKEPTYIPPDDLLPLMVTLLPEEEIAMKKFTRLCTWGYPGLWNQLLAGEFLEKIECADQRKSPIRNQKDSNCFDGEQAQRQVQQSTPPASSYQEWEDIAEADIDYQDQDKPSSLVQTPVGVKERHFRNMSPASCTTPKAIPLPKWEGLNEGGIEHQERDCPLPTCLQRTPVSVTKSHYNAMPSASCSTPVEDAPISGHIRPFAFNVMSPLQSKSVNVTFTDSSVSSYQSTDDSSFAIQDQDVTNCLSSVIADAIRDGYDLRSEHAEELEMFHFSGRESESATDVIPNAEGPQISIDKEKLLCGTEPEKFGFEKFVCPQLLTRHPPPATGRDDDPDKLREILDDLLLKLGYHEVCGKEEKILFGPDHKIGKNLLSLRNHSPRYNVFLPEFPLLHVRKHKITILFSAYKDAGLVQLLRYMRDDEEEDWRKLLSAAHIEMATKQIRRLSAAFHMAFLITFINSLPKEERATLQSSLENGKTSTVAEEWGDAYDKFIQNRCRQNATFCLHLEMMKHLDDVVAVSLAERLGGQSGYNLLLSSLKGSLLFSFLNGAVSYAPYAMQLILEHYKASPFHQAMKMALSSTPRLGSTVNFSGDTKREMDHLDALKGFRSGSTLSSVSKRMALVDSFQEVHLHYNAGYGLSKDETDTLGWGMSAVDWNHILPTVAVILRRGGLSGDPSEVPQNVYARKNVSLDPIILDSVSAPVGSYLLQRSACKLGLLGLTVSDIPEPECMTGPKHLVKKVASSKAMTIRRTTIKTVTHTLNQSQEEKLEDQRQKVVSKEVKQLQRISSNMNMCQSLVNPDCTKPKIQKSQTVPAALLEFVKWAMEKTDEDDIDRFILSNTSLSLLMSTSARSMAQLATIEFAGIKYKVKASTPSGKSYIECVENDVLMKFLNYFPSLQSIIVCEEKYDFTPDVLKSATRDQRSKKQESSIAHLKTREEMLCDSTFSKSTIVSTHEGKVMISNYLAENVSKLNIHKDVELIIDSGLKTDGCTCPAPTCLPSCKKYAVPIKCTFSVEKGLEKEEEVQGIKQRKGEGEMSQVDWLIASAESLVPGHSAISIVTSGDIDAVILHLLKVALLWPRDTEREFLNPVHVILSKPAGKFDIYCITEILRIIERATHDRKIGVKVAVGLCIGGNDFLPRYSFYGIHSKVLRLLTRNHHFLENLIKISSDGTVILDKDVYIEFVKQLYAPGQDALTMTFDEVRKSTIVGKDGKVKSVDKWLPPLTCIQRMADLTSAVIEYVNTAGTHNATLPDFEKTNCFKFTSNGKILYDFGTDAYEDKIEAWFETLTGTPVKQTGHGTVKRRQKSLSSTSRKRLFDK